MGWWKSETGQGIIGDGPIDVLIDAYKELNRRRVAEVLPPPSPELLRTAVRVDRSGADRPDSISQADLSVVRAALADVTVQYLDSELGRPPTAEELDETVDMALAELAANPASSTAIGVDPDQLRPGERELGEPPT